MTAAIGASARAVADPSTEITAVNPADGPASIENDDDEHRCIPGLLEEVSRASTGDAPPDAYVIACFGDPGLEQVRAAVDAPVLGIAQAAMHAAALSAGTFSVVTSMSATVPTAWTLAKTYTPGQCLGVHASDIPVLGSTPTRRRSIPSAIWRSGRWLRTAVARSYWVVRQWRSSPAP